MHVVLGLLVVARGVLREGWGAVGIAGVRGLGRRELWMLLGGAGLGCKGLWGCRWGELLGLGGQWGWQAGGRLHVRRVEIRMVVRWRGWGQWRGWL